MKKYLFITNNITDIGGRQTYLKNKSIFLKEKGWDVLIISAIHGEVLLNELKEFTDYIVPEIRYYPFLFSSKIRQSVINEVIGLLLKGRNNETDEIIIETHHKENAFWGEMIAKKLSCKHFIYLIAEEPKKEQLSVMKFLDFKHKRREIAGITKKSLKLLFKGYKNVSENEMYSLRAFTTINVVEDVNNPIIDNIKKYDINIGCISRLGKKYVSSMIDEIIIFAEKNGDKIIHLILVGDAVNPKVRENIVKKVEKIENIKLLITGLMYPIPRKLFGIVDIFIGIAGAARVSMYEGVLTISLDVVTHKPIGLLGYDTLSSLHSDTEQDKSLSDFLQDLLIKGVCPEKISNITITDIDINEEYNKHLAFIESSSKVPEFYQMPTLFNMGLINVLQKILLLFGLNFYEKIRLLGLSMKRHSLYHKLHFRKFPAFIFRKFTK